MTSKKNRVNIIYLSKSIICRQQVLLLKGKSFSQTCGGRPLVNDLQVFPVQEVTGAWLPCQHHGGHVPDDLLPLTVWHGREPLLQTQLTLATEEQQEAHLTTQRHSAGSEGHPGRMHHDSKRPIIPHSSTLSFSCFWSLFILLIVNYFVCIYPVLTQPFIHQWRLFEMELKRQNEIMCWAADLYEHTHTSTHSQCRGHH